MIDFLTSFLMKRVEGVHYMLMVLVSVLNPVNPTIHQWKSSSVGQFSQVDQKHQLIGC